ncbi:cytochrome P450 family protein [Actinosynnema sp. CS-041913]|uniref:cytochrome P450 family protein n=1 Tax=Actinosynnema sp. CS-041913 TaxID=3239917 RepID=UPI003D8F986F
MRIDQDFYQDPYSFYAECRALGPVRVEMPDGTEPWLLTRYDDVLTAFDHPSLSSAFMLSDMLNHLDSPDHTRLRKLVVRAFGARRVDMLRPRIQRIADDLLDRWADEPLVDLIDTFAFPLPIQVIGELMGVPPGDHPLLRELTAAMVRPADMVDGYTRLGEYLREFARTKPSGDDLTTELLAARDDGRLTHDELIAMLMLLIVAGHETTVQLIGNGVLALLRQPDRLAELKHDPGLLPAAVDELLRFDGPISPGLLRLAVADVVIGGARIEAGDLVLVSVAAANRDPSRYGNPDVLVFDRGPNLAFGHGIHHCLGARLARLEGEVALGTLLRRYPDVALATEDVTWKQAITRGLTALPVRPRP